MSDNPKKIIVVDDNAENLTAIKNALKVSYDVYPTKAVSNMFELMKRFQPDLVLLDVDMPDINGYEAARMLKSSDNFREIPIIFLTSMDDPASEMKGLNLGAIDYIHKPLVAPLLLRRIKTHLSFMEQQKVILEHNKEIEELLELMSREIRSPLNSIIDMISIASETDDIQTIKVYLKKAYNAGKHVLEIVNEASVRAGEKHRNIAVNVNENVPQVLLGGDKEDETNGK